MKNSAEPCINNFLAIHVPASNFKQDNKKIGRKVGLSQAFFQKNNPLMNIKLQSLKNYKSNEDQRITILYQAKNKSLSKKKKIEQIPLLSNLKQSLHATNCHEKLKIVKYQDKNTNTYNLIFKKNFSWGNQIGQRTKEEKNSISQSAKKREIATQYSNRALLKSNMSQERNSLKKSQSVSASNFFFRNNIQNSYKTLQPQKDYNESNFMPMKQQIRPRANSQATIRFSGLKNEEKFRRSNLRYREALDEKKSSHFQFDLKHQGEIFFIE